MTLIPGVLWSVWPPIRPKARGGGKIFRFAPLLLIAALLNACASHTDDLDKYQADLPEMMGSYTPRDDGRPLSPSELQAFKTVSDLDRKLSPEDAQIVELHFKFFVHEKRGTFERFLTRSARFLPYTRKVFISRGIPADLVYLFMVESGGNPNAFSPAGAAGLWQFIPRTGRKYGLTQNAWLDERRDPYKSTYAASDYLLKLYNDFEDWPLAAAAYNAGEGKIGKAVEGTGAKNFFDICRLDERLEERARLKPETRDYVPRLLAVAKIMRNLKILGFAEPSPDMAWDLSPLSLPAGTNLAGLAQHLDIRWSDFSGMNPAFRRTVSPPAGTATAYVPADKLTAAVTWASGPGARSFAGWQEYTVRKGDTLVSIAKRHKISVQSLQSANGLSSQPGRGEVLIIPVSGKKGENAYGSPAQKEPSPASRGGTTRAAASRGSSAQAAAAATQARPAAPVKKPEAKAQAKLSAPDKKQDKKPEAKAQTRAGAGVKNVSVKAGDTLYSIAKTHKVSVKALQDANNLGAGSKLRIGSKLILP
ncbi:MAG: LysM peptidoglycan-binding domain-containing protein [Desulfovibrio sp.]|jgi:membrane-bound lytic murein transglycosylase D|nr:LysM peptidoglycan-binding domain-containing protein [Desulfovibrio sp.]